MIDRGLLVSILITAAGPWLVARLMRAAGGVTVDGDTLMMSGIAGLVGGRVAFVALEDPGAFGRLGDLLIIRSGVEFWPGLVVGVAVFASSARRAGRPVVESLAVAAPLFLVGYGAYEAACILRDGCFGPPSAVGLPPPGFAATVFPVGLAVGALAVASGLALRKRGPVDRSGLVIALLVLAALRGVAGFFLPRVGSSLTRPHVESLTMVAVAVALHLGGGALARHTTSSRTSSVDLGSSTNPEPWKGP